MAVQNAPESHPNRYIVTVRQDVEGLSVDYHRNLLGLNGTESGTLKFEWTFSFRARTFSATTLRRSCTM